MYERKNERDERERQVENEWEDFTFVASYGASSVLTHVEDDICSQKQSLFVCYISISLWRSLLYVYICVRFRGASVIGSVGRCATEGERTIGCVETQSVSASARACREGRLVHVHTHTQTHTQIYGCSVAGTTVFFRLFYQFSLTTLLPLS